MSTIRALVDNYVAEIYGVGTTYRIAYMDTPGRYLVGTAGIKRQILAEDLSWVEAMDFVRDRIATELGEEWAR